MTESRPRLLIAKDLTALLAGHAAREPAAPAIIAGEQRISWAKLEDLARRAAQGLADLGVGPGDRVALWLPNVPAWLVLYFACCRLGAIAVAVNTRFRGVEVADIVARSGAKVLACAPGFRRIDFLGILADIPADALSGLSGVVIVGEEPAQVPAALERLTRVTFDDLVERPAMDVIHGGGDAGCNIFTTSGTTRAPKFVLHRQGAIAAHCLRVARSFRIAAPGMGWLPLCGVYGFNTAIATLAAGQPIVLMEAFDPEEAAGLIDRHRADILFGFDEIYDRLLATRDQEIAFPSVRWAGYANFNTALVDLPARADRRGLKLVGLYGMSEVQALFSAWRVDDEVEARARGGGHPVSPLAGARTRDPETGEVLPAGTAGELELVGPSMMVGYYGNPEATDAAFTEDRYLRTGDLGIANEDGSFVFLSRMGDALRLGGFLVNPLEIESHLLSHPMVADVQVVAAAGREGVRAVAFVVPTGDAGFDEQAVIAHARAGLANYKAPARVFTIDAFPTTPSANGPKIQRNKLRQMAEERLRGD
jgi:fatty-acyl-CoA synthase